MQKCAGYIDAVQAKNLRTDDAFSLADETINFLFAVNLYEDLCQELVHLYGASELTPIRKIFQSIHNISSINMCDGGQ